jgi:hypothetical protein
MLTNNGTERVKSNGMVWALGAAAIGAAAMAMGGQAANAAMLGVHFWQHTTSTQTTAVTGTAGYVAQANWNNVDNPANGSGNYPGAGNNVGNLVLSDGSSASGTLLSFGAPGLVGSGALPSNGISTQEQQNVYLQESYLDVGYPSTGSGNYSATYGPDATVTVSSLPTSIAGTGTTPYDVILYVNSANSSYTDVADYTVNGATLSNVKLSNTGSSNPNNSFVDSGTFTLATASTVGNYVEFTGITGTTLNITVAVGNSGSRAALDGFQVIATPEPGALGLLAAGGLGMLLVKRRRTA